MSELKVNSIKGTGASSAAITIHASDGTCAIPSIPGRNIIINGACNVAQRATTSTTDGIKTVDRMQMAYGGHDEAPTQAQIALTSSDTGPWAKGFRNAFQITNGNQTGGAGATDYLMWEMPLEAQDIANSGWDYTSASSKITLSFWVKSSVAQDFKGYLKTEDGTEKAYPFATGALSSNTWTKITKTIPGEAGLTFNNDNGKGLVISVNPMLGTDYTASSATENTWQTWSGSARQQDVTTTFWTTNDATFAITGIQLEVGDVATEFEHRSYGDELLRCQRYFETSYNPGVTVGSSSNVGGYYECHSSDNGDNVVFSPTYRVTKRAVPTDKFWKDDGTANQWTYSRDGAGAGAGVTSFRSSQTHLNGYVDCGASWVPCALHGHWSSEAEL